MLYVCVYVHVHVCQASEMLSGLPQTIYPSTLQIQCTRANSKQQHEQGYGRAETLHLQPQRCCSSNPLQLSIPWCEALCTCIVALIYVPCISTISTSHVWYETRCSVFPSHEIVITIIIECIHSFIVQVCVYMLTAMSYRDKCCTLLHNK